MHTARGGAAVETQRSRGGDSRTLIVQGPGPGQARGAEASRRRGAPFGPRREARGQAQRLCAPRPTLEGSAHHLCPRRREQPLALSPLVRSSTTLALRRWQGRGVARVAGCQNAATPAESLVAKQMTGRLSNWQKPSFTPQNWTPSQTTTFKVTSN